MRASILIPSITSFLLAIGCGGKSEPAAETTPPVTEEPAPAPVEKEATPPEGMKFDDMNHEQRIAFMKQSVMPTMKQLFQEYDAKRYGEFNCQTCHGAGAAQGKFEMPNPALPVLPAPDKFAAFAKDPKNQPGIKFMAEKVKPTMAKLLQETEYDPKTNTGDFGCNACHVMQGVEPKKKDDHGHKH